MKENKILNNSYNTGEMEFEAFTQKIKVDDKILSMHEDTVSDNLIDVIMQKKISEMIYDIFIKSPYYEKYKSIENKKIEKSDLLDLYYYFKEKLSKDNIYTNIQIFIGIAEFFQINYNQLYNQIGVLDKEMLLKEMVQYQMKHKIIKTKKLF